MKIFLLPALIAVMLLSGCSVFRGGNEMVNVRDFGAVGDGKTLDMVAIQKALDTGRSSVFPPEHT